MAVIPLETPDDPRVAEYAAISDSELVLRRGLFVAEGRLVVKRLIGDRRHVVRSVLLSEAARRELEPELHQLGSSVPIYVCPVDYFRSIAGLHIHRGCLALAERPPIARADELVRSARIVIVLESIANADNVGGVFRNAAAFGADAVLMNPSTCDPLYRKTIRTSMGASLRVPFARIENWPGGLSEVRAAGFTIVALTPRGPARTLEAFAGSWRDARVALLVGSEGEGLSAAAEAVADSRVRIPIKPDVDSLNVAVATGIALSRLTAWSNL